MSRQTRRSTTVADAADVSQMDPWKDDRCRDFLALNTIQRLRSYHAETQLPVEPVNIVRARNLVMLPKPDPLERTCETSAGCAIDAARIHFFGPMSFLSATSHSRATVSPHSGGGHARFCPSEDAVAKVNSSVSPGHGPVDANAKGADIAHAIDAGATPLRQSTKDKTETSLTPSPHPRRLFDANGDAIRAEDNLENAFAHNSECREGDADHTAQSAGGVAKESSGTAVEPVRFSCAIVETLIAYYQSLLSRGVVLDRFNAKDLAFAWWVVGRNMDVSALSRHTGSMRRDALLILVRHFYYELLTEQRLKTELAVKEISPEEEVHGETEKLNSRHTESNHKSRSSSRNNSDNDMGSEETQKAMRGEAEETSVKHTTTEVTAHNNNNNNNNNSDNNNSSSSGRKRPRSRFEPTRKSTPVANARFRRPPLEYQLPREEQSEPPQPLSGDAGPGDAVALPAAAEKTTAVEKASAVEKTSVAEKITVGEKTTAGEKTAAGEKTTVGQKTTAVEKTTAGEKTAVGEKTTAGEKTSAVEKTTAGEKTTAERPPRPPRGAHIEDVWRPLRAARRRAPTPPPADQSADSFAAGEKTTADPLAPVAARIRRRAAQDAVYASLAADFRGRMHPALLRLLRCAQFAGGAAAESFANAKREDDEEEEKEEEESAKSGDGRAPVGEKGEEAEVKREEEEEEEEGEKRQQQKARAEEPRVDWEEYMRRVAALMAEAKLRRRGGGRKGAVKSAESAEDNDKNEEENDDEAEEEDEEADGNADDESDESDDDDSAAPVVQPPCSFSELTYAQQCLLTWEASDILDPRCSVAALRRKKRERERRNKRKMRQGRHQAQAQQSGEPEAMASEGAQANRPRREFYDYWRNP